MSKVKIINGVYEGSTRSPWLFYSAIYASKKFWFRQNHSNLRHPTLHVGKGEMLYFKHSAHFGGKSHGHPDRHLYMSSESELHVSTRECVRKLFFCFLKGNCPPTPPLSQHSALSERLKCWFWLRGWVGGQFPRNVKWSSLRNPLLHKKAGENQIITVPWRVCALTGNKLYLCSMVP